MSVRGGFRFVLCLAALGGAACEETDPPRPVDAVHDGGGDDAARPGTDAAAARDSSAADSAIATDAHTPEVDPCCGVWGACTSVDADGDGFDSDVDCDDTRAEVNPGAEEGPWGHPSCCDGLDNDCSGQIDDEDFRCCNLWAPCTEEV